MFCPKCKEEYREGFYTCADCGVYLVDSLLTNSPMLENTLEKPHIIPKYLLETIMSDGVCVYEEGINLNKEKNTIWLVDVLEDEKIQYFINIIKHSSGYKYPVTRYTAEVYVSQAKIDFVQNCIEQYNKNIVVTPDYIPEENEGLGEELPQKTCPYCGKSHDFDYPKCPYCEYVYDVFL